MSRLFAALALVTTLALPREGDRGRPVILLVHGRGMVDRDTAATRKMWVDALLAGQRSTADAAPIDSHDVRVVWYADVLDPSSTAGCSYNAVDARARRAATNDSALKDVVALAGPLLDALAHLVEENEVASQLRSLSADASFLGDARKRCAAEQRLGDALDRARREGRPVVLVAHSMGAMVAYDYLSSRTDTETVERFITIGSPLGAPELRRMVLGGGDDDTLARPAGVKRWINVRNENDPFAAPIAAVGRDVLAAPPADEPDPHEMVGYLRGAAANAQILSDWCAAFATAPPACSGVLAKTP